MAAVKTRSMNGSKSKTIPLEKIRLDGDTQSRKELDEDVIKEYTDLIAEGVEFPPLEVVFDGADYWLVDGFHRRWAAVKAKVKTFKCKVVQGTREDARWLSYGVNIDHGLPRTPDDRKKAIVSALKHPKARGMSDTKIAEHVGVSRQTVIKYRTELEADGTCQKVTSRTGADGRTINTANIGQNQKAEALARAAANGTKSGAVASSGAVARPSSPAAASDISDDDDDCNEHVREQIRNEAATGDINKPPPKSGPSFDPKELEPQGDVKDGLGNAPPKELREAFTIREEFAKQRNALSQVKKWITQTVSHPGAKILESVAQQVKIDIDNADRALRFARPHCLCVYCKNKLPKVANCNACKGYGWITEPIYDQAPKELRK